jgi:RNA polymerase sigma-70 factor (ECF subfamily)
MADSSPDADATFQLLERAREGDAAALDALFARYLKPLQRWASGRLPQWARNAADTHDLVQDTLLNAFKRIGSFEPWREGAFQAYLRQAVMNRIRDELRRTRVRPVTETFDELEHAHAASPLEDAIELETFERYEAALARLTPEEQQAIIGRVELGSSYQDLAVSLGKPSADAARMAVTRALVRLAEEMNHEPRR